MPAGGEARTSAGGSLLRENPDFARLFWAATVTNFGSMVTRLAIPFAAIQELGADPAELALLSALGLVPGVLVGPLAGSLADRRRRRPLLVASDLGRAALYLTVPAAALVGALSFVHLCAVSLLAGVLRSVFSVAHVAYLPQLVRKELLVRANSRLQAAEAVTEGLAFGSAGWLVQLFSAPIALAIDSASFVLSAGLLGGIRHREAPPAERQAGRRRGLRDAVEGLGTTLRHPLVGRLFASNVLLAFAWQIFSVVFLLFVHQEMGFPEGGLGMVFAVGAASSFAGAMVAERATLRFGPRRVMVGGLLFAAALAALIPLVPGATFVGWAFLVGHQLGDGGVVAFGVNEVSLRQSETPPERLGRVNGSFEFGTFAAMLLGTALGGVLGETAGLRPTLWAAVAASFAACLPLLRAPLPAGAR